MKYKKGTFVVVPNMNYLSGKPTGYQALFMWLCKYADENGICYPSKKKLAENLGCDIRTISRYINQMVKDETITKTKRRKEGDVTNKSNLYQIQQQDKNVEAGGHNVLQQQDTDVPVTIPIKNSIHLTQIVGGANEGKSKDKALEKVPYSFIGELTKLRDSPRHDMKVIALYWSSKGFVFENEDQFKVGLKRELKAAQLLKGYSGEQIAQAIDYCKRNYDTWTLETVSKRISDLINKR